MVSEEKTFENVDGRRMDDGHRNHLLQGLSIYKYTFTEAGFNRGVIALKKGAIRAEHPYFVI